MIVDSTNPRIMADNIRELARNGGGGGSDLPDVTVDDNGKVLGVVEGSWNKMDVPSNVVNYSTSEQNTGTKWIDGKDIYQKTFVDDTTFTGTTTHSHYLTDSIIANLDEVIDIKTKAIIGGGDAYGNPFIPTPGASSANITNYIRIGYDPAQGIYEYGKLESGLSLTKLICTIYYTKTPVTETKKRKTTKGDN